MKKLLIPAVLAVALVLPAQAAAKTKHYTGAVSPSGSISFKVVAEEALEEEERQRIHLLGRPGQLRGRAADNPRGSSASR